MTDPPAYKTEGFPCSPASTIETATFKVVGKTQNGCMGRRTQFRTILDHFGQFEDTFGHEFGQKPSLTVRLLSANWSQDVQICPNMSKKCPKCPTMSYTVRTSSRITILRWPDYLERGGFNGRCGRTRESLSFAH